MQTILIFFYYKNLSLVFLIRKGNSKVCPEFRPSSSVSVQIFIRSRYSNYRKFRSRLRHIDHYLLFFFFVIDVRGNFSSPSPCPNIIIQKLNRFIQFSITRERFSINSRRPLKIRVPMELMVFLFS